MALSSSSDEISVLIPAAIGSVSQSTSSSFHLYKLNVSSHHWDHYYGELDYDAKQVRHRKRIDIHKLDKKRIETYRHVLLHNMDEAEDISTTYWHEEEIQDDPEQQSCRPLKWHQEVHPYCNLAHELNIERALRPYKKNQQQQPNYQQDYSITYLR